MDKRSIFERGFAILLSVILMAACFPLSIFAEDTTQDPDFSGTNLMNLENVQPSGYTTTTNPYGYLLYAPPPWGLCHGGAVSDGRTERADVSECLGQ